MFKVYENLYKTVHNLNFMYIVIKLKCKFTNFKNVYKIKLKFNQSTFIKNKKPIFCF